MKRLVVVAWAGLLLAATLSIATLTAQVAAAHAARLSAEPADGAALTTGPDRVSATFNERLQTTFAAMTVVGPDGNVWSTGDTTVQGAIVGVAVRPLGPVGSYTVNYRVTSADGHVVSGSWTFRLTVAGTGTPGPAAVTSDSGHDLPVWPFVAAAAAIVGAAVLWTVRRKP
ncbi:copper resistance protein CopC [Mycobacterium triplex]|uniref:Copper resistance protein CopC n=1 Tax=Mycobacterium triplex TaxID=47839 RepID=A0A024JRI6_9MYCO|nr:copper resistance CopC family protein [Mycobacterium triplex]ORX04538.1 copper resistance protein CopC [Mycobacterium triplex]CDO85992.1 copper resistance protein CopC [Mycobacterium triplex]